MKETRKTAVRKCIIFTFLQIILGCQVKADDRGMGHVVCDLTTEL
jgi:hypothetical protein